MTRRAVGRRDEVELNVAAMLDMAFQLLTFFILTFRTAPVEGQIRMRMPPATPVVQKQLTPAGADAADPLRSAGASTLAIYVEATPDGSIQRRTVAPLDGTAGERVAVGVDPQLLALREKMKQALGVADSPFDQVVLQLGSNLRYDELMRLVEVCDSQGVGAAKSRAPGLSFVEVADLER